MKILEVMRFDRDVAADGTLVTPRLEGRTQCGVERWKLMQCLVKHTDATDITFTLEWRDLTNSGQAAAQRTWTYYSDDLQSLWLEWGNDGLLLPMSPEAELRFTFASITGVAPLRAVLQRELWETANGRN